MRKSVVVSALICFSLLASFSLSQAATKVIVVKPMTFLSTLPSEQNVAGALANGKSFYIFGTVATATGTDGFISSQDSNGSTQWTLPLHEGEANILTSLTVDASGNLIVFGATSKPTVVSVPPSAIDFQNPDSVTVDTQVPQRNDITEAIIWSVSASGQLNSKVALDLKSPVLVTAGAITSSGYALVGNISTASGMAGFVVTTTTAGIFSKPLYLGKSDTEINAIVAKAKGLLIVGASSETIVSRPLKGKRDGLLISLNSLGKISAVVRSTNLGAMRSWKSTTASYFMGGLSVTGNKVEAVVTQFNSSLAPLWTTRFLALGGAITADLSATSRVAFFASTSAITGLSGWKASKGAGLALVFGTNGVLTGGYSATAITAPISLTFSPDLGLIAVGSGPKGVSVFRVLPR